MEIDYNTLSVEELEEHVEFIDWSMIPSRLLTDEVRKTFRTLPQFKVRIWIEDLLVQMVIKEDQEKFPDKLFFFIEDRCFFELNFTNGQLWCSVERIWSILEKDHKFNFFEILSFLKNVMDQYLKDLEVQSTILILPEKSQEWTDLYFMNLKIKPYRSLLENSELVKAHFKKCLI